MDANELRALQAPLKKQYRVMRLAGHAILYFDRNTYKGEQLPALGLTPDDAVRLAGALIEAAK